MDSGQTNPVSCPAAVVNITNRCTLRCRHCFVYREGNPAERKDEMASSRMLETLEGLRREHGVQFMPGPERPARLLPPALLAGGAARASR